MNESKHKRILALDGGGSRGFFTYDILRMISKEMKYRLCEKFDIIVGTSVGAIIASLVACGIEIDDKIGESMTRVFAVKNPEQPLFQPVYDGRNKTDMLKDIFKQRRMRDVRCPLALVTAGFEDRKMHLFRSWEEKDLFIWEVLDAASAAPTYFPPVKIGSKFFVDGGILCNTPVNVGVVCLRQLFPRKDICPLLKFRIMSIGNRTSVEYNFKIEDPNRMGIAAWIQAGLVDFMMGVDDDSNVDLIQAIYGEEVVLRIVANAPPWFDDVTEKFMHSLQLESRRIWEKEHESIKKFFQD